MEHRKNQWIIETYFWHKNQSNWSINGQTNKNKQIHTPINKKQLETEMMVLEIIDKGKFGE